MGLSTELQRHRNHKTLALLASIFIIVKNIISFIAIDIYLIYLNVAKEFHFIVSIIFFYISVYKFYYTVQFTFACFALRERFSMLNSVLSKSMNGETLQHVSKLYLDLCDLIEHVNSNFAFQIIFVVISAFVRSDTR